MATRQISRNERVPTIVVHALLMIFSINAHICSSEPVVSLKFYDHLFLKVNVKEYIFVFANVGTIACDVEDIPSTVRGNITLSLGSEIVKESLLQERPLTWRGNFQSDLPANFTCEVTLEDGSSRSKLILSEVSVLGSGNYSRGTCFPRTGDVFLKSENIPIVCVADFATRWILDDVTKPLLTRVVLRRPPRYRIQATNYVQITNSSSVIQCVGEGMQNVGLCNVSAQEIHLEDKLIIDINPRNFSTPSELEPLTFLCRTNLPTELISWEAKSERGNVLDLGFNDKLGLNFSIIHLFQSSELSFPNGVGGIIMVSCWTYRAGQSNGASSFNMTKPKEKESCEEVKTVGSTSPRDPFPVKVSTILIAFGILAILCVTLLLVVACLLKRQYKKGSSEESTDYLTPVRKLTPNEAEPYYSTSNEGNLVTHKSLRRDQQYVNVKGSSVSYHGDRNSTYELCS